MYLRCHQAHLCVYGSGTLLLLLAGWRCCRGQGSCNTLILLLQLLAVAFRWLSDWPGACICHTSVLNKPRRGSACLGQKLLTMQLPKDDRL
jgi:hypothetical protein